MVQLGQKHKRPAPKSGRMAIVYLLLLMLAICAMFSLKRCSSTTAQSYPASGAPADTVTETFVETIYE